MVNEMDKSSNKELEKAVKKFKRILDKKEVAMDKNIYKNGPNTVGEEVIRKYGSVFKPENLDRLKKEDFEDFLKFNNNKHWTGLSRGPKHWKATDDMNKLKETLRHSLNEEIDIIKRINNVLLTNSKPAPDHYIKGIGKGVLTAILFVVYPSNYCVWNNKTEEGIKKLNIWPKFSRGISCGEKYKNINELCKEVSNEYNLSLWQVDWIWWMVPEEGTE